MDTPDSFRSISSVREEVVGTPQWFALFDAYRAEYDALMRDFGSGENPGARLSGPFDRLLTGVAEAICDSPLERTAALDEMWGTLKSFQRILNPEEFLLQLEAQLKLWDERETVALELTRVVQPELQPQPEQPLQG